MWGMVSQASQVMNTNFYLSSQQSVHDLRQQRRSYERSLGRSRDSGMLQNAEEIYVARICQVLPEQIVLGDIHKPRSQPRGVQICPRKTSLLIWEGEVKQSQFENHVVCGWPFSLLFQSGHPLGISSMTSTG